MHRLILVIGLIEFVIYEKYLCLGVRRFCVTRLRVGTSSNADHHIHYYSKITACNPNTKVSLRGYLWLTYLLSDYPTDSAKEGCCIGGYRKGFVIDSECYVVHHTCLGRFCGRVTDARVKLVRIKSCIATSSDSSRGSNSHGLHVRGWDSQRRSTQTSYVRLPCHSGRLPKTKGEKMRKTK